MSPFCIPEGKRAFNDFSEWLNNPNGIYQYFELIFNIVLQPDPTLETDGKYDPLLDGVEFDICFDIWVCAALLDAALNGTDDSADCNGYEEEYHDICDKLKTELMRRTFLTKKQKYNTDLLRWKAIDALDFITGSICRSEAAAAFSAEDIREYRSSVDALRYRLSDAPSGQTQ